MAQTGFTPILIYGSGTTGNTPSAGNLTSSSAGAELAINYFDGKLFYKDASGVVQVLATKGTGSIGGSTTQVQYNNAGALAGSANLTFNGTTLTANALTVSNATTLSALTASTALALNASKEVVSVTNTGTGNNVLATSPTLTTPNLGTPSALTLTNATGLPLSTGVTGTLATTNGGTGLTSFTANGVVYASSTSALATGSALTFDGTNFVTTGYVKAGGGAASPSARLMANTPNGSAAGIQLFQDAQESWVMEIPASSTALRWAASGTEYMRLTNGGNLGIGTSSPGYKLDVNGLASILRTDNTSAERYALQFLRGAGTGTSAVLATIGDASNGVAALTFNMGPVGAATERMRLDSSGNVGIGTSSPGVKLDVNGQARIQSDFYVYGTGDRLNVFPQTSGNGASVVATNNANSTYAPLLLDGSDTRFNVGGFEAMRLTSTGLGIGTSSPTEKLDVVGGGNGGMQYRSGTRTVGVGQVLSEAAVYWGSGTALTFFSGLERMRLDSSGNLGLGVTPSAWSTGYRALDMGTGAIMAQASGTDTYYTQNAIFGLANTWVYKFSSVAATRYQQVNGVHAWFNAPSGTAGNTISFTQAMTLDASGNLLVGGTTQLYGAAGRGLIQVSGSTEALLGFGTTGNTGLGFLYHTGTNFEVTNAQNGYLRFGTNNTERMRLDSSGNLGLGVTPSAWLSSQKALEVSGWSVNAASLTSSLATNAYVNSSSQWIYKATGFATRYDNVTGQHQWYTAPSGTAGNTISFTQAMTLNASGELLVGTASSDGSRIRLYGSYQTFGDGTYEGFIGKASSLVSGGAAFDFAVRSAASLVFATNGNTERARIKSTGQVRFVPLASAPGGAEAGDVYYDSGTNKLRCYNGTTWNDLF